MSNTEIWDALKTTDPRHTKAFTRGGGFKGTAIKPQWVIHRLTEQFGPCGVGWGVDEPSFQVVPAGNEIMVYCTVSGWYVSAGEQRNIYGVGGDKVVAQFSSGLKSDDEAFKKAFTDAIMNAFKFIGVGADVHMGLFDDSKYVAEAKKEFQDAPAKRDTGPSEVDGVDWWGAEGPGVTAHQAKKDGWDDMHEQMRSQIDQLTTAQGWKDWCAENSADIKKMPKAWRMILRAEAEERGRFLGAIID